MSLLWRGGLSPLNQRLPSGASFDLDSRVGVDNAVNGGAVASWTEQVTGTAFVQATGAAKPTFIAQAYRGQPAIRFASASSQFLATASAFTALDSTSVTVFCVVKANADTPGSNGRIIAPTTVANGGFSISHTTTNIFAAQSNTDGGGGSITTTIGTSLVATGLHCAAIVLNAATPVETPYFDGVQGSGNSSAYVKKNVGVVWAVGAAGTGIANFLEADICRILAYPSALAANDIRDISRVLMTLYRA